MSGFLTGRTSLTSVQTADIADDAITLAKLASGTDGQVITYDASVNPSVVGPGTDGQVLTSTGAGSPPAFEAASSPALSFVSSTTISGTSTSGVEFTGIDNTSETWMVQIEGIHLASDVNVLQIQTSNDTSSHTYDSGASDYGWAVSGAYYSSCYCKYDASDDSILMGADPYFVGNDATTSVSSRVFIHNPSVTTYHTLLSFNMWYQHTGATPQAATTFGVGKRHATEAVTAVKFSITSGNFEDTGRFSLYKLAHS